jgi:azurin
MRMICRFVLLALALPLLAVPAGGAAARVIQIPAGGAAARVIQIEVGDSMRFNPAAITAAPGEQIRIVLKGVGQMPKLAMGHNFVLLKKGTDGKALAEQCAPARETDFIAAPAKGQILAHTSLVGPGETVEVTFAAPRQRGDYQYICTFPGHFALGMKGTLTVK